MAINDLYSKRAARERGEVHDVYRYDNIPAKLRIQITYIWREMGCPYLEQIFGNVARILCREHGWKRLPVGIHIRQNVTQVEAMLEDEDQPTDILLDIIELVFSSIEESLASSQLKLVSFVKGVPVGIQELNTRLKENGVGYRYEKKKIIRIDSELLHSEVVKPALKFLSAGAFTGANAEFFSAFDHYNKNKYKECLNDCLKAFESTMKSICTLRGWEFAPNITAKGLIDLIFKNHLIPDFMESHFTSLRSILEAGVPTVRNKLGGHGQGAEIIAVPTYLASYALHLTATNILMLCEANRSLK